MVEQGQFQENDSYDEVPRLYHARIVGAEEQVELARKLLKSGMMIETVVQRTGVSVVGPGYTMTAESIQREIERLHEKARHDEAQALHHAKQEGRREGRQEGISERNTEIARNALQMGMPIEDIAKLTGLTCERIESLRKGI